MLYATKESGAAIGEVIAAITATTKVTGVEIRLTQDEMITSLKVTGGKLKIKKALTAPIEKTANKQKRKYRKHGKKRGEAEQVSCDGRSMSAKEWATRLGVAENTVRYRISKYGNPYGRKGPTDGDKVVAGA